MKIIDTHCDALYKIQNSKVTDLNNGKVSMLRFADADELDTNLERLKTGNVHVQFFAIFIEPDVPFDLKWQYALEQIDIFYEEVLAKHPEMKHIKKWSDIDKLQDHEIGAVLALEGADCFGNDLIKLRQLYRLGVLSIGLTWNNANLCADGVGEGRGGGLTNFGKKVVELNNEYQVLTDVSHLSERSFWDVLKIADYPFASHSNAKGICNHPRNLSDAQIKEMFNKGGMIHVVFYPGFVKEGDGIVTLTDVVQQIEYLCNLGGVGQIGFGSDFDGIPDFVEGLENAGNYQKLIEELLKHYSETEVRGFAYGNFLKNRPK